MAPIWEQFAEEFKSVEGLVIADFDATANEAEGVDIRSFPTLKFFKNGVGTDYEGGREFHNFRDFIMENSEAYKAHIANGGTVGTPSHTEDL
jgi:protein disulfide-isomerase A1